MNQNIDNEISNKRAFSPSDAGIAFILCLVVPQVVVLLLYVLFGGAIQGVMLVSALVPQLCFFSVYVFVTRKKRLNFKTATALNFKINIWVLLLVLLVGIVAMFGFSPLINLFDTITSGWGYKSSVANIDVSTFWKFFASIFYVALLPAICEELVFRGIIANGFKKYGTVTAVVLSAVLFALMHQNLQQLVYQLFLGGVMAYIVIKTGSIIYTMLLHFFNNFVILLSAHLFGEEEANVNLSNAWEIIKPILIAICAVLIIVGILWLINYVLKRERAKKQNQIANAEQSSPNLNENKVQTEIAKNNDQRKGILLESMDRADRQTKFYKNPYVVSAIVIGIVFWILVVISMFKA